MSEFAQTTNDTIKCLGMIPKPILPAESLKLISEAVKPLDDAMRPLLIKEGSSQADEKTVKAAVRCILNPNPTLDKLMNKIYVTSSNLLTLSTQYLVYKSILTNPEMFAEKVQATEVSDVEFKNSKTIKGMKKFMIAACTVGAKTTAGAKKNLLDAFDSTDEEVDPAQSSSSDELSNAGSLMSVEPPVASVRPSKQNSRKRRTSANETPAAPPTLSPPKTTGAEESSCVDETAPTLPKKNKHKKKIRHVSGEDHGTVPKKKKIK